MTLSSRHAPAILALLVVALIPIAWTSVAPRRNDPCRDPGALLDTQAIEGSVALGQKLEHLGGDVIQWSEGVVPLENHPGLEFQIVRSFDARTLYENPTRLMVHEIEPEEHDLAMLTVDGVTLPIHVVRDGAQSPARIGAYMFVYGNQPVRYPFLHAIGTSIAQTVGGTRPLTALLVELPAARRSDPELEARAAGWVVEAWRSFAAACR